MSLEQSLIFIIGILLTSGLFYLILFFGFRQKLALLFISLFCFCQAAKAFFRTDAALAMQLANFSEAQSRLATGIVYTSGSFFLMCFIALQLNVRYKKILIPAGAFLILLFFYFHLPQLPLVLTIGMAIAIYSFGRQKLPSVLIILGLLLFGSTSFFEIQLINKVGYFIGIISFIITITILIGYQIREQIRLQRQALIRSAALENQMLKRSFQPHFLFNSLMSLQEWIETRPDKAAQFVQALAEEFRTICNISGHQLIPIEQELSMCEAHLQIMGFRKHACFTLKTEGINGSEMVPPAIFHTLIENGLTHGYAERKDGSFTLSKYQEHKTVVYELFNDGSCLSKQNGVHNGTGLKYIKARLEESYPNRWSLQSGPVEQGWNVKITIKP